MTLWTAKEQLAEYARAMYRRGMANKFEGNLSLRWEDGILITPSRQDKEAMTPEKILELDGDGRVQNPECGLRPSSEYQMHLALYRLRPDAAACVHDHSVYATAFAVAGRPIESRGLAEAVELFGEVPVVPYGRPGTEAIADGFVRALPRHDAVLLENHGVLTLGPTLPDAFALAEAVEKVAKILLLSALLGGEKALPESEVDALRRRGRKNRGAGPA